MKISYFKTLIFSKTLYFKTDKLTVFEEKILDKKFINLRKEIIITDNNKMVLQN